MLPAQTIVNLFDRELAKTIIEESPGFGEIRTHQCAFGGTPCDSWSDGQTHLRGPTGLASARCEATSSCGCPYSERRGLSVRHMEC